MACKAIPVLSILINTSLATNMFAGTGALDNLHTGGAFASQDAGQTWSQISGLNATSGLASAGSGTGAFYAVGPNGMNQTNGSVSYCDRSTLSCSSQLSGYSFTSVVTDLFTHNSYAASSTGGIFKVLNGQTSWSAINTGLGTMNILSLARDPGNQNWIYAGSSGQGLYRTTDGSTWQASSSGLPTGASIYALMVSGTNLFAGTDSGIYIASITSGSLIWSAASTGIGKIPVYAFAFEPSAPQNMYAGTDSGIFKTTTSGQ